MTDMPLDEAIESLRREHSQAVLSRPQGSYLQRRDAILIRAAECLQQLVKEGLEPDKLRLLADWLDTRDSPRTFLRCWADILDAIFDPQKEQTDDSDPD